MNYILHLTGFFLKVSEDSRLNPTHISLYMAIFQFWNLERFRNPVSISRQELMRISKICAKATYHKCIKDLHNFGYIRYLPSYNPFKGSLVHLFDFQTSNEQDFPRRRTNIETSIEQVVAPYINTINLTNQNEDETESTPKNEIVVKVSKHKAKVIEVNGEKVNPTKEKIFIETERLAKPDFHNRTASEARLLSEVEALPAAKQKEAMPPMEEEVRAYFRSQGSTEVEGQKFHNYFQSNGWRVGGKSPMLDWQAAARNWMLNAPAFSQQKTTAVKPPLQPNKLNAPTSKNYSEPL
jgi:hypothetical protein